MEGSYIPESTRCYRCPLEIFLEVYLSFHAMYVQKQLCNISSIKLTGDELGSYYAHAIMEWFSKSKWMTKDIEQLEAG